MKRFFFRFILLFICVASCQIISSQTTWWGYYNDVKDLKPFGEAKAQTYNAAMFVAGDHPVAGGKSITGVRFYLQGKTNIKDIKVWVSKSLPSSADKAAVVVTPDFQKLEEGFNDIAIDAPFNIDGKGVYVGYSLTITNVMYTSDRTPLVRTDGRPEVKGGLLLKTGSNSWTDYSQTGNGNIALKIEINGQFDMENSAYATDFPASIVLKDNTHAAKMFIVNCGVKNIEDFDYVLTIDGQPMPEKNFMLTKTLKNIGFSQEVNIPIETGAATGRKDVNITITKINGKTNELDNNATSELFVVGEKLKKKIVEEEYTGTWCGWCPRGMKGMELSEQLFGEDFIGIAIHYDDIMQCDDYANYIRENVAGFPYCMLNRAIDPDTYFNKTETGYGLDVHIRSEQEKLTPATVEVKPFWTDEQKNAIKVMTNINFALPLSGETPYALAYVMVADGLEGYGSDWQQDNLYSGAAKYANDENLAEYYNGEGKIRDMVYNHVALAGWNIGTHQSSPLKGYFQEGEPQGIWFEADLKNNKFISDPDKYN